MSHPVYGDLPYNRLRLPENHKCTHCGYNKASIGTEFQSSQPFCERCGRPWHARVSLENTGGSVAIIFEEIVSECADPNAMNDYKGELLC
jgi:hypothetical protein